jgi:acyl-CoA thioesterase
MSKEELIKNMENSSFIKNNNYKVIEVIEGKKAILKGIITETSNNPYNIAHGGFIFGLGDTAMGVAASSTGKNAVTLSATINYLKPSTGKYLIAEAEVIKSGKKTCYLQTNIYNDNEELVATMDSNYCYVK